MTSDHGIDFPNPSLAPDEIDFVAVSAIATDGTRLQINPDIEWPKETHFGSSWTPEVLVAAYSRGIFPMPYEIDGEEIAIGWWSPQPRAVFYPNQIRITRSLRKSSKNFKVSVDQCFSDVIRACGNPNRPQGWINESVIEAYSELHERGMAHSVEVWNSAGDLVGGLYGLEIGGLFAGESMFHIERDASKVALMHLANLLNDGQNRMIDSQWATEHLESLGVKTLLRQNYVAGLPGLLEIEPILSPNSLLTYGM
jgi:leucyl/phenylalanyl-tRNA--protein transferase